ncbi:hypothetical protein OpiT1DRAFT_03830 [Opitutaceae bacterium TAV1]|nr:hypothetical protein OpiT1DRAFT_03830 [Opitutaceae bacterium TAV1]
MTTEQTEKTDVAGRWLNVYSDIRTAEQNFGPKMRERVAPVLENDPEPLETKARIVNIGYYLEKSGGRVDADSVVTNWPVIRRELARQWFAHDKPTVSDRDLYDYIGSDMRRNKNDDDSMTKIAEGLQQAAFSGEADFIKALAGAATLRDHDGRLLWQNPATADKRLVQLQSAWAKWRPEIEEMKPLVDATMKYMGIKTGTGGKRDLPGPGWSGTNEEMIEAFGLDASVTSDRDIVNKLLEFTPEKQALFFRMLAGHGEAAAGEKDAKEKTQKTLFRSFDRTARWLSEGVFGTDVEAAAELNRTLDFAGIRGDGKISEDDNIRSIWGRTLLGADDAKRLGVDLSRSGNRPMDREKERVKDWRPLTDEEKKIIRAKIDRTNAEREILDTLREIEEGNIDPVKYEGWGQKIWYGGLEQSGYVVQALAGPLALPLLYLSTVGMRAEEYRARGVDADQAANLAVVEAAPEAAIEMLEKRLLLGKVPGLGRLLKNFRATTATRLAARAGVTLTSEMAWQAGQELLQDSIPLWWQEMKADASIGIPKVDFDDPRNQVWTWSNAGDVTLSMFMYTLVGTGAASLRDAGDLRNARNLRALGFTDEAVTDIIGQETPDLAEFQMRLHWDNPDMRNPRSGEAGAARAEMAEESAEAAKGMATGAKVERGDGGKFTVTAPDGNVIGKVDTAEAAATLKENYDSDMRRQRLGEADAAARKQMLETRSGETVQIVKSPDRVPSLKTKEAAKWARDNLRDQPLHNDDLSADFFLSRDGISKMVEQGGGKPFHRVRVAAIYSLKNLVKYAKGVQMPDGSGSQNVSSVRHLWVPFSWQGSIYRMRLLVREFSDKNAKPDVHSYRIEDVVFEKEKAPPVDKVAVRPEGLDPSLSDESGGAKPSGDKEAGDENRQASSRVGEGSEMTVADLFGKVKQEMDIGGGSGKREASVLSRFSRWFEQKWHDDSGAVRRMNLIRSAISESMDGLRKLRESARVTGGVGLEDLVKDLPVVAERLREAIDSGWLKKEPHQKLVAMLGHLEALIEGLPDADALADKGAKEKAAQDLQRFMARYGKWIDGSPLEVSTPGIEDVTSRLRNAAAGVVSAMIERGMVDFSGKTVGPALMDAVKGLGAKRAKAFNDYLLARRALAVWNDQKQPGRNPGIPKEEAEATVARHDSADFRRRAQIVYEWASGLRNYASQASTAMALGSKKIDAADPGDYVPLWVGEHEEVDAADGGPSDRFGPELTGDTRRPNRAPLDALMRQAEIVVERAHARHLWETARNLAQGNEALSGFVEKVSKDEVPGHEAAPDGTFDDVVTDGDFVYGKDGASGEWFRIEKGIYDAINSISQRTGKFGTTVLAKSLREAAAGNRGAEFLATSGIRVIELLDGLAQWHARAWRAGATGWRASFGLGTNVVRDLFTLNYNTRVQNDPLTVTKNWFQAMALLGAKAVVPRAWGNRAHESISRTAVFKYKQLFENLGMNFANSLTFDSNKLEILKKKVGLGGKLEWTEGATEKIQSGWEYFVNVLQFPELAARVAEMKSLAEKKGWDITEGLSQQQIAELVRAGKEVTVDFTRAGEWARVWNRYVPFINSSIQGKKSSYDAFRRNPVGWLFTRGLVVSLVAAANWWRNKDEEWWKEIEAGDRFAFDFVRIGDEVLRIPRAFDVDTVFKGFVVEMLDAAYHSDPDRVRDWFGNAFEEFSVLGSLDTGLNMDAFPPSIREGVQQAVNRDFFWKSPIVSRTMQRATEEGRMGVEEQYGPFTSRLAIGLGEIFGWSPRRVDHAVRGLFAGVGGDLMTLAGRGAEADGADLPLIGGFFKEGDWEPSDFPIWGRAFLKRGGTEVGDRSVNKLYEAFGKMIEAKDRGETPADFWRAVDAVRAVQAAGEARLRANSREERMELSALRADIAREAVEEFEK